MAAENVIELTDANFDAEVNQQGAVVLVDFWAEWCMPCRMLAPTIDELAKEYAGRIKVGKVDTDGNRTVPMRFGITSIPTVIAFRDGQMRKKFVGLQQKKDIKAAIEELLKG